MFCWRYASGRKLTSTICLTSAELVLTDIQTFKKKNLESRTEGAVSTKPNLFELCRIASEVDNYQASFDGTYCFKNWKSWEFFIENLGNFCIFAAKIEIYVLSKTYRRCNCAETEVIWSSACGRTKILRKDNHMRTKNSELRSKRWELRTKNSELRSKRWEVRTQN